MTQFALPSTDAYNGDVAPWADQNAGVVNIYQAIAELVTTPDDNSWIDSNLLFPFPPPGVPNIYVTKLSSVEDPQLSTGHVVRIRAQQLAVFFFNPDSLITELRQGYVNEATQGTLIATWTDPLTVSAFVDFSHTLTGIEADAITDYGNLYLRFSVIEQSRISAANLEVPDVVRRARVHWTELEVPYLQQETIFIENRIKKFNEALLLEELAASAEGDLTPTAIYFGGGFVNDAGNQFRTWDPATTPKPGFASGDIQFTYPVVLTTADRIRLDNLLDAHVGTNFTDEQLSEDLDQQTLDDLQSFYDNFSAGNEHVQDDALKLVLRRVLRMSDRTAPTIPNTPKPDRFVHDAAVAGLRLVPVAGDPSGVNDGDLWYNLTTNKFRKREGGTTSDLSSGGGGGAPVGASYVTIGLDATLTNERTLAGEASVVSITDGGANNPVTVGLANDGVSNAKLANMAQSTIKGRAVGAGTGDPTDLTTAQATAILDLFTSVLKGLVPASGGGTTNFLRADGAWAAPASGPTTTKKTADQTKNNTTLADMTDMSFAVTSGRYYHFQFFVLFRSAGTTTGIRLSLSIPTVTTFGATARIPIAADGAGGEFQGWITASDDPVIGTGVQAANTDYVAVIEGTILPSANGTLQVRFANETGAVVVTARQGSTGILFDLGT